MTESNTRVCYRYTDGSNCKREEEFVVAGVLAFAQLAPLLDEGRFFIPGEVGLPELQNRFCNSLGDNDHVWHELLAVEEAEGPPTGPLTATRLLWRFRCAAWDEAAAWQRVQREMGTAWRSDPQAPYRVCLAARGVRLAEARLILLDYARLRDGQEVAGAALVDRLIARHFGQGQRAGASVLRSLLVSWNPPRRALDELAQFAQADSHNAFPLALLLHAARQDRLLYDLLQRVGAQLRPRAGLRLTRPDLLALLEEGTRAEVRAFRPATRAGIARGDSARG